MAKKSSKISPESLAANLGLEELRLFTLIARLGSFSAAAEMCGLTQSAASKRIKKLEQSLNLLLFDRSQHGVVLTDVGVEFQRHCQGLLERFEATVDFVQSSQEQPGGKLTILLPSWMALVVGGAFFVAFRQRYPNLSLTILFPTKERLLADEGIDVYIGLMPPTEKQLKSYTLMPFKLNFYASQGYLDSHPALKHPNQLMQHECLGYRASYMGHREWPWTDEAGEVHRLYVNSSLDSELYGLCVDMACHDGGVVCAPEPLVKKVDSEQRLVKVFGDKYATTLCLTASHPHYSVLPHKVRVLTEALCDYLK